MKKETVKTKKEKSVKDNKSVDDIVIKNDANRIVKLIAYLSSFFASIFAIIVFVFGIITTISVTSNVPDDIIHNNFVITFISKIGNSTIEETKIAILSMGDKFCYVSFNIVLPTLALVCASILIILLSCQLLKFFDSPLTEKKIFTEKKLRQLENIVDILSVIIFISWALFNQPSVPFILLIYLLFFIVYYLYKKCVTLNSKK